MKLPFSLGQYFFAVVFSVFCFFVFTNESVLAHHPFEMGNSLELSFWKALVSGIGHPLVGPDHLLFMIGIVFVGLKRTKKLVLPLLFVGLAGSVFVQFLPLSEFWDPWAELFVSLSLAIEGFIILNVLSSYWLFPMFALHGYLLGSTIIGAEPTPLLGYFGGLLLAQGCFLFFLISISREVINRVTFNFRNLLAGIWIGIGLAFSWTIVIP